MALLMCRGRCCAQLRDLPYLVIKWLVYTYFKTLLASLAAGSSSIGPWLLKSKNLLAGAAAGAVAATTVTPADVIKTRLQAARGKQQVGTLAICHQLLSEGGLLSLFSGLGPRLMRIPVYTAVTLATFDFVKDLFVQMNAVVIA